MMTICKLIVHSMQYAPERDVNLVIDKREKDAFKSQKWRFWGTDVVFEWRRELAEINQSKNTIEKNILLHGVEETNE